MLKFLVKEKDSMIFNGEVMKIYIPTEYFEQNIAEFNGNEVNTIAFFFFEVKTFEYEEKNKDGQILICKLPAKIAFEFVNKETETRNLKDTGEIKYEVFTLNKGSIFMKNVNVIQSAANAKDFIYMLHKGHFPSIIPYNDIMDLYIKNLEINKLNLGSQSIVYELIIADLMRDKDDIKTPFRKVVNKGKGQLEYKNISMKNIAFQSSTYSGIAFEDINKALIGSVAKDIRKDKEIISPVEKTIKY